MKGMISFCGIDCSKCDAYVARKNNDHALREYAAVEWQTLYGHTGLMPEDINCDGCLTMSCHKFLNCKTCRIRQCGIEKKVENCAHCENFPCETLSAFHAKAHGAKANLEMIRQSLI